MPAVEQFRGSFHRYTLVGAVEQISELLNCLLAVLTRTSGNIQLGDLPVCGSSGHVDNC